MKPELRIALPEWLVVACRECGPLASEVERMDFVIGLARRSARNGSGPFAAAVFEIGSGRLAAAATNLVVSSHSSMAHAEVLALALAQQARGSHDLRAAGPAAELVTSCEPCAMCLGAIVWSGVRRVVCAARGEDAEAIGFDEGPKPADWAGALRRRGIEVVEGFHRDEAAAVLRAYLADGGVIYNAGASPL